MDDERRCEQQAASQYGVISLKQALAAGLTRRRVRTRREQSGWEAALPCVYRLPGTPRSWLQDSMAVLLWAGPGAALSHGTAATLWGLEGVDRAEVHVASPTSPRIPRTAFPLCVHAYRLLPRIDLATLRGLRVTSVTRTLVDLSPTLPNEVLEHMLDQALVRKMTSTGELLRRLGQLGVRGRATRALRALVMERTGTSVGDSELES